MRRAVRRGAWWCCGAGVGARRAGVLLFGVGTAFLAATGRTSYADDPPIVYVSRLLGDADSSANRPDTVVRALSGNLLLRRPDGTVAPLVSAGTRGFPEWTPVDVADPSVSFDGRRIVFAGYSAQEKAWRIYQVGISGIGLRQITRSDRSIDLARYGPAGSRFEGYDDVDPCYLPDGRICFVSTRYPGDAPNGRRRATNLYVVDSDGTDLHRITTERFGADTPTVDPVTGRIVYSRWWLSAQPVDGLAATTISFSPEVIRGIRDHEFPGVNTWTLTGINPDGTDLRMFTGSGANRALTIAYRPAFLPHGELLWMFIRQSPVLGMPGEHGLRLSERGASVPTAVGGPQNRAGGSQAPRPYYGPPSEPPGPPAGFFYTSAEPLPDGRLLVTGHRIDETGFDVFIQTAPSATSIPEFFFGTGLRAELDAVPIASRERPPIITDAAPPLESAAAPRTVAEAMEQHGTFRFIVENIHFNAPVDTPIATAPPVGADLTIEFYMNTQREGVTRFDAPLLVGSRPIGPDGRVEMELPAGVPLFEVLRRPDGTIALGRDGQAYHVGGMNFGVAGSEGRCVGCHTGHSMMEVPEDPSWTNLAPSARVTASRTLSRDGLSAPEFLVDRRATGPATWWDGGVNRSGAEVELEWLAPVRARRLVLHRPQALPERFMVSTYRGDELREEVPGRRTISPISVGLDGRLAIDRLKVSFPRDPNSQQTFILREIEVIAKPSPVGDSVLALPGDADCDGSVRMADAVAVLAALFRGSGPLCCEAAAERSGDGRLGLADAVVILQGLFGSSAAGGGSCKEISGTLSCSGDPACP